MIVVAAGIVSRKGKIMLCQRRPGDRLGLKWEFPGGKLEKGETPQQALERELREELAIETRTGRIFDVQYSRENDSELLILFFYTEILSGEPQTVDCQAIAWTERESLLSFDLAANDMRVAARLASE